ncbi:uncharacterized protein LOC121385427 [Gigantopelta aegis]|uniref:uncharacterized protein LOC121385427 n=1 Tax=Gigantopelta aegis TaxID=1735272 RepID=UPI001B88B759|nr:uncharacterized protein LOC121385427 [Gigantopelta aegis]
MRNNKAANIQGRYTCHCAEGCTQKNINEYQCTSCEKGFDGPYCQRENVALNRTSYQSQTCPGFEVCSDYWYGDDCDKTCNCKTQTEVCDKRTGLCQSGCPVGWTGTACDMCSDYWYGDNCDKTCNCKIQNEVCDKRTGSCISGCKAGWTGTACDTCVIGKWGPSCANTCGHCVGSACDRQTGSCQCQPGWATSTCTSCVNGKWGPSCANTCGHCVGSACDRQTGSSCVNGKWGPSCANTCGHCPVLMENGVRLAVSTVVIVLDLPVTTMEVVRLVQMAFGVSLVLTDVVTVVDLHVTKQMDAVRATLDGLLRDVQSKHSVLCVLSTCSDDRLKPAPHPPSQVSDLLTRQQQPLPMQSNFQFSQILYRGVQFLYSTAKNVPNVLQGIQIGAHGGPRQSRHSVVLEMRRHSPGTVRPGVVIHVLRPCSEWVVVEMWHHNWFQDLTDALVTCQIALNGDQVQLAVMGDAPPNHYRASSRAGDWAASHVSAPCLLQTVDAVPAASVLRLHGLMSHEVYLTVANPSQTCVDGLWGQACSNHCGNCKESFCDKQTGSCQCQTGWAPPYCTVCAAEYWGQYCNKTCGHCKAERVCNKQDASCECQSGWAPPQCTSCVNGLWGPSCQKHCGHCSESSCNNQDGSCLCQTGWAQPTCTACLQGRYGVNCSESCGHCINGNAACNNISGQCAAGCSAGWIGDTCHRECSDGYYGIKCNNTCGQCIHGNKTCDKESGHCPGGCDAGWTDETCKTECQLGRYGNDCKEKCDNCKVSNCSGINGTCLDGCIGGYTRPDFGCKEKLVAGGNKVGVAAGGAAAAVAFVVVIVVVVVFWKRRQRNANTDKEDFSDLKCTSPPPDEGIDNDDECEIDEELHKRCYNPKTEDDNVYANVGQTQIEVANLHSFIKGKTEGDFQEEYELLPSGLEASHNVGKKPCNKIKNRFVAIFPYDHSRVHLEKSSEEGSSDYINANYIGGYKKKKAYIATQGKTSIEYIES